MKHERLLIKTVQSKRYASVPVHYQQRCLQVRRTQQYVPNVLAAGLSAKVTVKISLAKLYL